MLESITIKNIALISSLTIDLTEGLSVLTGETGAGKSLIIDSLSLLLGEKADKSLISYGEQSASVEAVFTTNLDRVLNKMEEFGLDREQTIIISRKISVDGKNECRVNGKSFTLSMLKQLTSPLMDLHGQFQHQEILQQSNQLMTIDEFGKDEILPLRTDYLETYRKLKIVERELSGYNFDSESRERMLDLYKYQIDEIEQANFYVGEEEELKEFSIKVSNQEKIISALGKLSAYLGGDSDGGAVDIIKKCDYEFGELVRYLPEQSELAQRITSVRYEIQDISDSVDTLKDNLVFDPEEAEKNEKRLDLLHLLKKKYGSSIEEINGYLEKTRAEYEKVLRSGEIVQQLEGEKTKLLSELAEKAEKLSQSRKLAGARFEKRVKSELDELSMKGSEFEIEFDFDEANASETGFDKVEFLFTANAGQPLKPLSKVVSGGEMSRFMLAVKNITADIDKVDTMIFDEIDTGISGETANVLGEKLAKIGKTHQVICVTHLAQVACYGLSHFFISKNVESGKTKTSLKLLNDEERVFEIARIIGGEVSDYSLSHARLMLTHAKNFK